MALGMCGLASLSKWGPGSLTSQLATKDSRIFTEQSSFPFGQVPFLVAHRQYAHQRPLLSLIWDILHSHLNQKPPLSELPEGPMERVSQPDSFSPALEPSFRAIDKGRFFSAVPPWSCTWETSTLTKGAR